MNNPQEIKQQFILQNCLRFCQEAAERLKSGQLEKWKGDDGRVSYLLVVRLHEIATCLIKTSPDLQLNIDWQYFNTYKHGNFTGRYRIVNLNTEEMFEAIIKDGFFYHDNKLMDINWDHEFIVQPI